MAGETLEATCRNGHRRLYRPPAGRSVKCREPTCRVSLHIPVAAAPTGTDPGSVGSAWDAEGPPGPTIPADAVPYPVRCPECDGDRVWEGRRTLVYCPGCHGLAIPDFVADRHERRQTAKQEKAGGGELEPIADDDDAALELAENRGVILHALRNTLDDDRLRIESRERLKWYADEIGRAGSMARLAELAEKLRGERIRRIGWFTPAIDPAEILDGEIVDDDADDWDDDDGQEDADETPVGAPLSLPPGSGYAAAIRANGFYDVDPAAPRGQCQVVNVRSGTTAAPLDVPQPCGGGAFRQFGPFRLCPGHHNQFTR